MTWYEESEKDRERRYEAKQAEKAQFRADAAKIVGWLRRATGEGLADRATRVLVAQDIEDNVENILSGDD